jgi:multicomponent Na+:H+ antiporter subunit C
VELFEAGYVYWAAIIVMMIGLYAVIAKTNLLKKIIGLGLFQAGILLVFVSMAHELPQAMVVAAVAVGISILATAAALTVCIREDYGTVDERDIKELEREEEAEA